MQSDTISVKQGMPADTESLIQLLNGALDGHWDEDVLRWKYHEYPGFDEEHCFYISIEDDLIAFRRLFRQEIISVNGDRFDVFTGAESVVRKDYRNKGLFSLMLSETTDYANYEGADIHLSYNREGEVTHKMKRNRGWNQRVLSVRVRVLSLESIIQQLAASALGENGLAARMFQRIPSILFHLPPDKLVTALVEGVSTNDSFLTTTRRRLSSNTGIDGSDSPETGILAPSDAWERIDDIVALYETTTTGHPFHFRRERPDIEHMLAHPRLSAVATVERDDQLVGYAPMVIDDESEGITGAQILDVVARTSDVFDILITTIEQVAGHQDVDLIVMMSNREPGPTWARFDKQLLMWQSHTDTADFSTGTLEMGFYDALG